MLTNIQSPITHTVYRMELKKKIRLAQQQLREKQEENGAKIIPRTKARNYKSPATTLAEEQHAREEMMAEQIKAWRSMLPTLIKKFSRIPDPRRAKSVKHKVVVLMVFGLLAFVFRLSSRREMNRELTGAAINQHLQKLFPELDSIPHADTLARLLEKTHSKEIESAHIALVRQLINGKKLKRLLINGCLPISIDGSQKLFRDGLLHDSHWLQRTVGKEESRTEQQYVYIIEANITLKNGLNIPLLTEYLAMDNNQLTNPMNKQDCELRAFERLAEKLKTHFPRLKIILFMDALYATQAVMGLSHHYGWEYMIKLPKNKLKHLAKRINAERKNKQIVQDAPYYRGRRQEFYWVNGIEYGYDWQLSIALVACLERREELNKSTGEIEVNYSEHVWISSVALSIDNVYEMCNLGARKKQCIEDSMNTEKNRGYHYKHAFSYNWNAMQCFHLLMRLGHAINALSKYTKKLKKYVKENGAAATLKFIKDSIFAPWLTVEWYEAQRNKTPQLRFQME